MTFEILILNHFCSSLIVKITKGLVNKYRGGGGGGGSLDLEPSQRG